MLRLCTGLCLLSCILGAEIRPTSLQQSPQGPGEAVAAGDNRDEKCKFTLFKFGCFILQYLFKCYPTSSLVIIDIS